MRAGEKAPIVLVAAHEDVLNAVRDALADTNLELLHAQTRLEAIGLLERLKCEIDLAIIELELPDFGAWGLIRQLRWRLRKPVRIIAATSLYPSPVLGNIKELAVDAVVPKEMPREDWRRMVETVLGKSEGTPA